MDILYLLIYGGINWVSLMIVDIDLFVRLWFWYVVEYKK